MHSSEINRVQYLNFSNFPQSDVYSSNNPFPHIVIDNFLNKDVAEDIWSNFPEIKSEGWINYFHYNENKYGLNKRELLPKEILHTIDYLNSEDFISKLESLSGISGLMADPSLEGAGIHQSEKGGFLNIHADFQTHPHHRNWIRRMNLIIFFNKDWKPEYRGELELWTKDMKKCEVKVSPVFNRAVIFNTDEKSYHGFPDKINFPEGDTRKSIALYYYTMGNVKKIGGSTNYKSRPGDGIKALFIWLDKKILYFYSMFKGALGIDDTFVSNTLAFLKKITKWKKQ